MSSPLTIDASSRDEKTVEDKIQKRLKQVAKESKGTQGPQSSRKNALYALIIGVDRYAEASYNLSGAVRDATRIHSFLLELHPPVSDERIKFIQDDMARAEDIIGHITSLRINDAIKYGDPILIYYAGHGSTLPTPAGWPAASSRIQCISPHGAREIDGTVDGVIPDLILGLHLRDLAMAKGDNITVILDNCHSGSGTREGSQSIARGIAFRCPDGTEHTISPFFCKDLWDGVPRGLATPEEFAKSGLQSHVVLAACGPGESAYEDRIEREDHTVVSEGRFTSALLRELKIAGTDTMTYSELIRRLGNLPSQTPQCEGRGKDTRMLFDTGLAQHDRDSYDLAQPGTSSYILHAGQINGVVQGDVFAVYTSRNAFQSGDNPCGELVVQSVHPLTSEMSRYGDYNHTSLIFRPRMVAVLARVGAHSIFTVHVDPQLRAVSSQALAKEIVAFDKAHISRYTFVVSSLDTALLSISQASQHTVKFEVWDKRIRGLGLKMLSGTVACNVPTLRSVLRSAAHFFYHLRSSPKDIGLRRAVSIRIHELRKEGGVGNQMSVYNVVGEPIDVQAKGGFYPKVAQSNDDTGSRTFYGVDVSNESPLGGFDLFVWMFYFDCSTLEIRKFYEPPAGKVQPPLRVGAKALPLNYGSAGFRPLAFELPEGQELDVGFIRIFIATYNSDLSGIVQAPVMPVTGNREPVWATSTTGPQVWDAITLAVVQRPDKPDQSYKAPRVAPQEKERVEHGGVHEDNDNEASVQGGGGSETDGTIGEVLLGSLKLDDEGESRSAVERGGDSRVGEEGNLSRQTSSTTQSTLDGWLGSVRRRQEST